MVKGIEQYIHSLNECVQSDIYLQGTPFDIIEPERIVLDMSQQLAIVCSCKTARIPPFVTSGSNQQTTQLIKARNGVTIPPCMQTVAPIQPHDLPDDRDSLFEPVNHLNGVAIYTPDVNWHTTAIQARNDSGSLGTLQQDTILRTIGEIKANGCCFAETNMALRAVADTPRETTFIRVVLAATTDTSFEEGTQNSMDVSKTCLQDGITIHGDGYVFEYSKSLKNRNSYLDTTENLRPHTPYYVSHYASTIASSQMPKPSLTRIKRTGIEGNARKRVASITGSNRVTPAELDTFQL